MTILEKPLQSDRFWTGVGTRKPLSRHISRLQSTIGSLMTEKGWKFLSGGAIGSDFNYLKGVCSVNPSKSQIWRPLLPDQPKSNGTLPYGAKGIQVIHIESVDFQKAREYFIKNDIIKHFDKMDIVAQWLHARNYYQIFSMYDVAISEFVTYDAPEDRWGNVSGGTRTAVEIARNENVPTFNLRIETQRNSLLKMIKEI